MKKLTIDKIKNNGWLIFEAIVGSKAYGLDTAKSDTDIRGVFVLPKKMYYGLDYVEQVNNDTNDIVYYELKRFIELLSKNNPNVLEMLQVPENCVLHRNAMMGMLKPGTFLSRLCHQTYANYAFTQIKKAYGLEKKIVNPVDVIRKSVLDFCFVYRGDKAVPLDKYLSISGVEQNRIGLTAISHLKGCYNLFYSDDVRYSGIVKKEESNDVCLSCIPKGQKPVAMLYFNKEGYSTYCKKYNEYWDWVGKRNEQRYSTTMAHGKNYDSKNMMHVFRLLLMAKEIAIESKINVFRKDKDFLLSIKEGKFEYDELLLKAEILRNELPMLYQKSVLPDEPSMEKIDEILIQIREKVYDEQAVK